MSTVAETVKAALRLIGVIATGETPSGEEQADAISTLNDMLEQWALSRLMVYDYTPESFSLVASTASYTIGSGGTLNTTRPLAIETAFIRRAGTSTDYPLALIANAEYRSISQKTSEGVPSFLYYEGSNPLGTIYLYPTPDAAHTLHLTTRKQFTAYSSGATSIAVPPGYAMAIKYNLALMLSVEYGVTPSPLLVQIARDTKAEIKRLNNLPTPCASFDAGIPMGGNDFDINRGF